MEDRKNLSYNLIISVALLTAIGLIFIYSASSITAAQKYNDMFFFAKKQGLTICLGLVSAYFICQLPIRLINRGCLLLYGLTLCLLLATHLPSLAKTVNGASRWISFLGFSFQPAELTKLTMILVTAKNLSRPSFPGIRSLPGLASCLVPVIPPVLLLMLQPDFGSAFLVCVIVFCMLFVAGLSWKSIGACGLLAIAAISAAVLVAPYRMARITSFLNPWDHAQGSGFQIIQSYLGFYNGSWLGLGIGGSMQKLYFLPEAHTDFILSVIGEELGLAGILLVLAIFAYLTFLCIQVTALATGGFAKLLCFGLSAWLSLQTALNMGVAMGLLPTKGMPLPFISHGSSSLIVFFWAIAILVRVNQEGMGEAKRAT